MTEAENADAATKRKVADTTWIDDTLVWSHALRPFPPVYMKSVIAEHRPWACDEFVLRLARQKHGIFTSTSFDVVGSLHQCRPEDFLYVHEPLGVMACLIHMVVHRCGGSWRQVASWIDLPNNGSSLHCRRIFVGSRNEPNWCCAYSQKRLSEADDLDLTSTPINDLYDLASKVYGVKGSLGQQGANVRLSVGCTFRTRKRGFDDAFHFGVKKSALLKQVIDTMVDALVNPSKRARYNAIVQQQSGKRKSFLRLDPSTPGIQFILWVRLLQLCERLLEELRGCKVDLNSLVFIALHVTIEGPQSGKFVAVPRLPVRILRPLPIETVFTKAFGISLRQYSKTFKSIQLIISNPRFTRQMGWCVESNENTSVTKCLESKSPLLSCTVPSPVSSPISSSPSGSFSPTPSLERL